jgi:ribokinase
MQPSVVVVGSSNTDLVGRTPRIPVPGETVMGDDFSIHPGGKGANQAVAAARLGADVTFLANIGLDDFGDASVNGLLAEGIRTTYICRDEEYPSGVALIVVSDSGENSIAVIPGSNGQLMPFHVDDAAESIRKADVLLVQLETPLDTVAHALATAHGAGVMTVLNPAPAAELPDEVIAMIDYLTPNKTEAERLSGITISDSESAGEAGQALIERGARTVIVTLGDQGALLVTASHELHVHSPIVVSPVDTTAAGDAFNGALAVALARKDGIGDAMRFACSAGALSVTRLGAQPSLPRQEEVEAFVTL